MVWTCQRNSSHDHAAPLPTHQGHSTDTSSSACCTPPSCANQSNPAPSAARTRIAPVHEHTTIEFASLMTLLAFLCVNSTCLSSSSLSSAMLHFGQCTCL